jgi:hypothetical protein
VQYVIFTPLSFSGIQKQSDAIVNTLLKDKAALYQDPLHQCRTNIDFDIWVIWLIFVSYKRPTDVLLVQKGIGFPDMSLDQGQCRYWWAL